MSKRRHGHSFFVDGIKVHILVDIKGDDLVFVFNSYQLTRLDGSRERQSIMGILDSFRDEEVIIAFGKASRKRR